MNLQPHVQQAVRANIAKFGWHTQSDFNCQGGKIITTYTIGLSAIIGHELIVSGLRMHIAHEIFVRIFAQWIPENGPLPISKMMDDFANVPTLFMECDPSLVRPHIPYAQDYFKSDVRYVQMVIPDRFSRFPNDPLFDHAHMDKRQDLMYQTVH